VGGRLPDFVIVGAARAGTTALHEYLRPHPEVFLPPRKELHFFDANFDRGLDWYRAHFDAAEEGTVVGEATPSYLYRPEWIDRMAAVVPTARLVAILRHPVDRAWSHYWMNRWQGREPLSFADALAREDERVADGSAATRRFAYLGAGRYLPQLEHAARRYPRERILVLLFDDLRTDPASTYRSVCRFLGVTERVPDVVGSRVNAATAYRSVRLWRLSRRLPQRARWARAAVERLNERPARYPALPESERGALIERFRADNAALAAWLGRDLDAWDR
jgi:hypothetical protein